MSNLRQPLNQTTAPVGHVGRLRSDMPAPSPQGTVAVAGREANVQTFPGDARNSDTRQGRNL